MNKYLIALISSVLFISSMIFIFSYENNEVELESFINNNKIEYGSIENIISERKALDSTIWKLIRGFIDANIARTKNLLILNIGANF